MNLILASKSNWKWLENYKNQIELEKRVSTSFIVKGLKYLYYCQAFVKKTKNVQNVLKNRSVVIENEINADAYDYNYIITYYSNR